MIFAGGQIAVTKDRNQNVKNIKELIDYAVEMKADYYVTPEYSVSGWTDDADVYSPPTEEVAELVDYAASKNVGSMLATLWTDEEDKVRNQIRVYDRDGTFQDSANKLRTWGPLEVGDHSTEAIGNNVIVMGNGNKIGLMLCNDLWGGGLEGGPCVWKEMLHHYSAHYFVHATNARRGHNRFQDEVFSEYHNAWMRMLALDYDLLTVDNAIKMEGDPYYGETASQSGILRDGYWVEKPPRNGVAYFANTMGSPYEKKSK